MKMWLMEGESCGVGDYQVPWRRYVPQIRDWLQSRTGEALLMNGDDARPVRASDISVLVRSRREAAERDALTLLEIPSVYLSNRDSVLKLWKRRKSLVVAGDDARRENTLRSALATSVGLNAGYRNAEQ